jgi:hypothetical protein
MEACHSSEKITDKEDREQIEVTPNSASDQCAEDGDSFGALKSAESDGLVFDKCTIGSAIVSEGVSGSRLNMNSAPDSREFEFDISGLNAQPSIELDSIGSPADELFYKGRLLPLHVPLRIQMLRNWKKWYALKSDHLKKMYGKHTPGLKPQTLEIGRIFLDIVPVLIEIARN